MVRVFSRTVGERVVTFAVDGDRLVDPASGSSWDPQTGQPLGGPPADMLEPLPWVTSYDWAWLNFYPDARIVG